MKNLMKIYPIGGGDALCVAKLENNSYKKTLEWGVKAGKDFTNADLKILDLHGATLTDGLFFGADFFGADLSNVDFSGAVLIGANLKGANLIGANLSHAKLIRTNLEGANLFNANLLFANIKDIKYDEYALFFTPQCPEEGSFIGWKNAGGYLIKLLILEDAKRSSATSYKCRCSKAKVLDILNFDLTPSDITEIASNNDCNFIYKKGQIVTVKDFDDNRWNECSTGIHFFISKEIAINYIY